MNHSTAPADLSDSAVASQTARHTLSLFGQDDVDPSETTFTIGAASCLFNGGLIAAVAAPLWIAVPDWMQASLIGCVWGAMSLTGLVCSWSRQRLVTVVYALALASLAQTSLQSLTDLGSNAAWLSIACALSSGWSVGWILTPWQADTRLPHFYNEPSQSIRRASRWSMWDIGGLATFVATVCWLVPRLDNQFVLLCRVAPALLGGALVSLMAVEWGWRDRWSASRLIGIALGVGILSALCWWSAPAELHQTRLWQWMLSGPGSVMAAQGLTVLGAMAALRVDAHLALVQSRVR